MSELLHRIKVFLYRMEGAEPRYLQLKPDQGYEALWGPVQGDLGFGDQLDTAIRRRVIEDVGVLQPGPLLDLDMPSRWTIGDEERVDPDPAVIEQHWAAHRWAGFAVAYPTMGLEFDRAAIMRLHTLLLAA
jgi:hypothetical protein